MDEFGQVVVVGVELQVFAVGPREGAEGPPLVDDQLRARVGRIGGEAAGRRRAPAATARRGRPHPQVRVALAVSFSVRQAATEMGRHSLQATADLSIGILFLMTRIKEFVV